MAGVAVESTPRLPCLQRGTEPSPEFERWPEFKDFGRDSTKPEVLVPIWGSVFLGAAIIFQGEVGVGCTN